MSLPQTTGGYILGADEGEGLWFNGALGLVKASGEQTEGRLAAIEFRMAKGFASPLHVHRGDDELFIVLAGDIRFQLGDDVHEGTTGSIVYGPRTIPHAFHVDSTEARVLLIFGPAGTEDLFREAGKPALSLSLPPAEEQFADRETLIKIANAKGQDIVGPPLPPLS